MSASISIGSNCSIASVSAAFGAGKSKGYSPDGGESGTGCARVTGSDSFWVFAVSGTFPERSTHRSIYVVGTGSKTAPSKGENQALSSGETGCSPDIRDTNWPMMVFISSGRSDIANTVSQIRFSTLRRLCGLCGPSLWETSMIDLRWKDCLMIRNGRSKYIGDIKSAKCNGAQRDACPVFPPDEWMSCWSSRSAVTSAYYCWENWSVNLIMGKVRDV